MTTENQQHLDIDTKLLTEFLYALNIARRQVQSYPQGHPMVISATSSLVEILPRLLEFREKVTFGVARDALIFEGEVIDATNPVYKDLAQSLFEAQVASLTINQKMNEEEVCRFFELFQGRHEEVEEAGGLDAFLSQSGFRGIRVQGIDFSAFSATEVDVVHSPKTKVLESDAALLWKSFANGIVSGTIDPDGQRSLPTDIDPDLLAEILNSEHESSNDSAGKSYEAAIASFLQQSDREKIHSAAYGETLGRFGDMVGKLKPKLRRQFLNSMFKNCAQRADSGEELLEKIPRSALLDAMENIDPGAFEIPQTLMDVMGKLADKRGDSPSRSRVAGDAGRSDHETAKQLAGLFSEDRSEFFVPRDYQDALAAMAGARTEQDEVRCDDLVSLTDTHKVEEQFAVVLADLLSRETDEQTSDAISQNMIEMSGYFLEVGDFKSLLKIYSCLQSHASRSPQVEDSGPCDALKVFSSEDFIDTVLNGFDDWEKPVHASIDALIEGMGPFFIEPLLDRLADEPRMARRRQYMQFLINIGDDVVRPIAPRLSDERWYFVRNLVIVLREIKSQAVLEILKNASGYRHPKVQFEIMKTFLQFGQKEAKKALYKQLASRKPVSLVNAVRLAAGTRDHMILARLMKLLNRRLPAEFEHEILSIVLKTLQETATIDVLPELEKFLTSKGLFRGPRGVDLKIKALKVLEKIGSVDAGLLAGEVAQSATGELTSAAEDVLTRIHRKLT